MVFVDHCSSINGLFGVPSRREKCCSDFFSGPPPSRFRLQRSIQPRPSTYPGQDCGYDWGAAGPGCYGSRRRRGWPFLCGDQANLSFSGRTYHSFKILKVSRASRQECVGNRHVDSVPLTVLPAVKNLALLRSCPLPTIVSASIDLKLGTVCPQLRVQGGPGNILGCC